MAADHDSRQRRRPARCAHGNGLTLCFECFRDGSERTRARQEAWAQRSLPFEQDAAADRKLTPVEIAHRRRMLAYLESTARRA